MKAVVALAATSLSHTLHNFFHFKLAHSSKKLNGVLCNGFKQLNTPLTHRHMSYDLLTLLNGCVIFPLAGLAKICVIWIEDETHEEKLEKNYKITCAHGFRVGLYVSAPVFNCNSYRMPVIFMNGKKLLVIS